MPVVEPLAVLLLLAVAASSSVPEYEPLAEAAGTPGVGLVTLALSCQRVAGQTPGRGTGELL